MKIVHLCFVALTTMSLAACVPPPFTQDQLVWGVVERHYTQQCIRNGWSSNPVYLARYRSELDAQMAVRAPRAQLESTFNALQSQGKLGSVTPPICREVEARAIQRIYQVDAEAQSERDEQQSGGSAGYQPRFMNCTNYAGVTNCVRY